MFPKLFNTADHLEHFWYVSDHLNIFDFIFAYKQG